MGYPCCRTGTSFVFPPPSTRLATFTRGRGVGRPQNSDLCSTHPSVLNWPGDEQARGPAPPSTGDASTHSSSAASTPFLNDPPLLAMPPSTHQRLNPSVDQPKAVLGSNSPLRAERPRVTAATFHVKRRAKTSRRPSPAIGGLAPGTVESDSAHCVNFPQHRIRNLTPTLRAALPRIPLVAGPTLVSRETSAHVARSQILIMYSRSNLRGGRTHR